MINHSEKYNDDPIRRLVEKENLEELSPFDPPDAYNPQNIEPLEYEKLHPLLKELVDEHKEFIKILNQFEEGLINWQTNKWIFTKDIDEKFKNYFTFIDEKVTIHNQKEEKKLFPLLHNLLIEIGEHNYKDPNFTGIDVLEDEHMKIAQASAIVFNFLGLGSRLTDWQSKEITFQSAYDQGLAIIETMKLHIFREENILFPLAMKFLFVKK